MSEQKLASTVKSIAEVASSKVAALGTSVATIVASYKKTIIIASLFGTGLPVIKLLQNDFGLLVVAAAFALVFVKLGGFQALSAPDEADS